MIINEFHSRVDKYFQNIVGFPPRNFQKATILKILNRQDVLLRAATGSGKTETAIAPFLFAQELQNYLPQGNAHQVNLRRAFENLSQYLVFFAVLSHDLGKLQVKWQEVVGGEIFSSNL